MAIKVENICLAKLELEVNPENVENLEFNIGFSCQFNYPEPNLLILTTDFDLARELEKAPFTFKFTFISVFSGDGVGSPSLQEFAEYNAPSYVIPYARELVANISSRLGIIPPLILPPVNVFQLIQDASVQLEQEGTESNPE